jgi:hypothetical protein
VPFRAQVSIVVNYGVEDRCQHSSVRAAVGAKPIEHELSDGGIPDQIGAP